jgi:hypothetical protein
MTWSRGLRARSTRSRSPAISGCSPIPITRRSSAQSPVSQARNHPWALEGRCGTRSRRNRPGRWKGCARWRERKGAAREGPQQDRIWRRRDKSSFTRRGYALLTNLDPGQADATRILLLYKGQEAVERRYSAFKGPLAVAALFLKSNRRIAALVTVICLALLIFCLVERQVRQALAEQGQTKIEGMYAGRPATLIFESLATMKIIPAAGQNTPVIPQPTPLQLRLLGLLDTDPRQLR